MGKQILSWNNRRLIKVIAGLVITALFVSSVFANSDFVQSATTSEETGSNSSASLFKPREIKKEQGGKTASRPLTEKDVLVCENSRLALYVDEQRAVIKVQDKTNNYVWSSGLDEADVADLTAVWKKFSQALIVAEYVDRYAPTTPIQDFPLVNKIIKKSNGIEFQCRLPKLAIDLTVSIVLDKDGFTVEIPNDKIVRTDETVQFRLSRISVLPFFGAVESLEADGYLFVPDGCGALIRFGETKKYSLSYTARVYGKDFGITRLSEIESDFPVFQDLTAHMPVFGIAHGNDDNAFAAIITGGAEYADITAHPAGAKIDYFWSCPMFNFLEAFYQPTGTGKGFTYLPEQPNIVNAKVAYKLLSGEQASYVGMANCYKKMLIENGGLIKRTSSKQNIPLHIDAYMAEQSKGLFGTHTKALTKLDDVGRWVTELKGKGIDNILVSLNGYNKKGASGASIGSFSVERKIGGEGALKRLYEQLSANGYNLFLKMNYGAVYDHQTVFSDFVTNIDHSLASVQEIGYLYDRKNFISSRVLDNYMQKLKKLPEYKRNVLMDGIGYCLMSDYTKGKTRTRTEALEEVVKALGYASENLNCLALNSPNAYAFKFADLITNVPDTHSQYIYESDVVPFLQIVLSGYVDCFSTPLNFGSLTKEDVLRMIDFNMYPAYLMTESLSSEFNGTNVLDIYFSDYDSLKPYIFEDYSLINEILAPVYGRAIVNRTVVENGVSVVEYEGNIKIVINYNDTVFHYENTEIPGKSAVRFGG